MNPKRIPAGSYALRIAIAVIFVLFLAALLSPLYGRVMYSYEKANLALHPTAALAYEYGDRYFERSTQSDYNISFAEYFYRIAATLDPAYPYVFHQLARIEFLNGNFTRALALINVQIRYHGDDSPNSYYIRALIEGYMGKYADSAADYKHYLSFDPHNWAAINDYAWVLLKAKRYADAETALSDGLKYFPGNPWLHNSRSIARFESGNIEGAGDDARLASIEVEHLSIEQWLTAYPGNDPNIAAEGIAAFKNAVKENMHSIESATTSPKVQ